MNLFRSRRSLVNGIVALLVLLAALAVAPSSSAQAGCVSGPSDPDRGKRPMCDTPSGTYEGVTYSPTVQIAGGDLRPGGQVQVTGSGWRPGNPAGVSVRWNDAGFLPPPDPASGVLSGSPLAIDAAGNLSGTITLPTQASVDFVLDNVAATDRTWLRFLSSDPAISLHVEFQWASDGGGPGGPGSGDPDPDPDGGDGADLDVHVEVPVGGLGLRLAGNSVELGEAEVDDSLEWFVATGSTPDIIVTDLREDDAGWTLSGRSSDFVGTDGDVIDGRHLGWVPQLRSSAEDQVIGPGPTVAPGTGFKAGATLASALAGDGRGVSRLGARLDLRAPTTSAPGGYQATIVITLV